MIRDSNISIKDVTPGYCSYQPKDRDYFYGREKETIEILQRLSENHFLTIVGEPGIGKSSLVNGGIIPSIEQHFRDRKTHVIKLDRMVDPFRRISEGLHSFIRENRRDVTELMTDDIYDVLKKSAAGLSNIIDRIIRPEENLFFIIDHLEEVFFFDRKRSDYELQKDRGSFFSSLSELILHSKENINVLLVLCSNYLGDIYEMSQLGTLVNQNSFLLNRISSDQLKSIISGISGIVKLRLSDFQINQLIAQYDSNKHTLSSLQYSFGHLPSGNGTIKQKNVDEYLTLRDELGTLLSIDLNSKYLSLNQKKRHLCERLFKSLFIQSTRGRFFPRELSVKELSEIMEVPPGVVEEIIHVFSDLQPPIFRDTYEEQPDSRRKISISHSLIFVLWDRYAKWIEEEIESVNHYLKLSAASELYQQGKGELLTGTELSLMLDWRQNTAPNYAWAKYYHPAFNRAMIYLELCEKSSGSKAVESGERIKLFKTKRFLAYLAIGIIIVASAVIILIGGDKAGREPEISPGPPQRYVPEPQNIDEEGVVESSQRSGRETAEARENTRDVPRDRPSSVSESGIFQEVLQTDSPDDPAVAIPDRMPDTGRTTEQGTESTEDRSADKRTVTHAEMTELYRNLVRGSQIETDPEVKALLAYQAFIFKKRSDSQGWYPLLHEVLAGILKSRNISYEEVFSGHTRPVNDLVARPGSPLFYSAGSDGQVCEWNMNNPGSKGRMVMNRSVMYEVLAISADAIWLAAAAFDGRIHVLNLKSGSNTVVEFGGHTGKIKSLCFTPDNIRIISTGTDKKILIRNILSGELTELPNSDGIIMDISISPDGKYLAGCTRDGFILIWDMNDMAQPFTLYRNIKNSFYSVEFTNSGSVLCAGDLNGSVHFWRFPDQVAMGEIKVHSARILDIRFNPEGTLMATAGMDGSIALWKVNAWNEPKLIMGEGRGFVFSTFFSSQGDRVFWCNSEGNDIIATPVSTNLLANRFCSILTRNFTPDEWSRFVGAGIEYETTCPALAGQ